MITHKKKLGIYHWDTFDNETILIDEADDLAEAEQKINERYKGRISPNGADQVDVVDQNGNVLRKYKVC